MSTNLQEKLEKFGSLGGYLKASRMEKQLSVDDIFGKTKIRKSYIIALEEDNYADMPERTYSLGYLRAYCNCLDLDDVNLLVEYLDKTYHFDDPKYSEKDYVENRDYTSSMYKDDNVSTINNSHILGKDNKDLSDKILHNQKKPMKLDSPIVKSSSVISKSNLILLTLGVIIVGLALYIWISWSSSSQNNTELADDIVVNEISDVAKSNDITVVEVPKVEEKVVVDTIAEDDVVILDVAPTPTPTIVISEEVVYAKWPQPTGSTGILIKFDRDVWVRIYNKDEPKVIYLDKIFKVGSSYEIPGSANLMLDIGNYKGVQLIVDNELLSLTPPHKGSVLRNIDLDKSALLSKYKK